MSRRQSIYVDGYAHVNPIPAACRVDNVVYSSVIHGVDKAAPASTETLEAQVGLMFTRLRQILVAAGCTTADLVKVTISMQDRGLREHVNRHWVEMFPDAADRPARHTVNAQLDGGQLIQCDFVAVAEQS